MSEPWGLYSSPKRQSVHLVLFYHSWYDPSSQRSETDYCVAAIWYNFNLSFDLMIYKIFLAGQKQTKYVWLFCFICWYFIPLIDLYSPINSKFICYKAPFCGYFGTLDRLKTLKLPTKIKINIYAFVSFNLLLCIATHWRIN